MAFHKLEFLSQLHDGYQKAFRVAGHNVLLIQQDGKTYLIENRCPHMDAALTNAAQEPGVLRCRVHGIEFGLNDGKARGPLAGAMDSLKFYPVAYDGNTVGVEL
jgi:nitrite reductase/ring-hydroxylating ferredoxin subunit